MTPARSFWWIASSITAMLVGATGPWAAISGVILDGIYDEFVIFAAGISAVALIGLVAAKHPRLAFLPLLAGLACSGLIGFALAGDRSALAGGRGDGFVHTEWGIWVALLGSASMAVASGSFFARTYRTPVTTGRRARGPQRGRPHFTRRTAPARRPAPNHTKVPADAMSAGAFMNCFGASCRTKHLAVPATRRALARFGSSAALEHAASPKRRLYPVTGRRKLPPEYIRLDPWEAEYLFLIASLATRGIVEIGRLRGGSTFLLACANTTVPIWSIDVEPRADDELRSWLSRFAVGDNVHLLVGDSRRGPFPEIGEFDLLFIDGNHSYKGSSADLENFFPQLAPGGHVLVHDCYGRHRVQRAVLDFITRADVEIVCSPYIPAAHWHTDHGSIAHLRKPGLRF